MSKIIDTTNIDKLVKFDCDLLKYYKVKYIVGVDEVGRGSLVGPVVAGASLFKSDLNLARLWYEPIIKLNDSKKLNPKQRKIIDLNLQNLCYRAIGSSDVAEIDTINIYNATKLAMKRSVLNLLASLCTAINEFDLDECLILIDGNMKIDDLNYCNITLKTQSVVKGDNFSASIAAASVTAKVYRDNLIVNLAQDFPNYKLDVHKGYATQFHRQAIAQFGLTKIHRKSFKT